MGVGQVFTMPPFFARNAIHPADIMPGASAASLGGLDTPVFVGGIGENAAVVRARICDGLGFLGIALEEKRNGANVQNARWPGCTRASCNGFTSLSARQR
jgi:hypothetical protein